MSWIINQSEIACTIENQCMHRGGFEFSLIPAAYQGWFLLIFLAVGIITISYLIYTTNAERNKINEEKPKEPEQPRRAERRKLRR